MPEIITAWLLIVTSPIDQPNMPFFEDKSDCVYAAELYKKVKKEEDAYCKPVQVELIQDMPKKSV